MEGAPLTRGRPSRGSPSAGERAPLAAAAPHPRPLLPAGPTPPAATPRGSASPDPHHSLSPSCFYSAWPRRRSPRRPRSAPRRARPALPLPRSAAASAPPPPSSPARGERALPAHWLRASRGPPLAARHRVGGACGAPAPRRVLRSHEGSGLSWRVLGSPESSGLS